MSSKAIEHLRLRADSLATRGEESSHLDRAIDLDREALGLCPPGRPASLSSLAGHLSNRYHQFGDMKDIEEAIVLEQEALDLRPKGHPDRSISLINLAGHLLDRHNQLGVIEDLERAIALGREAHDLRPKGHPDRSESLDKLASCLGVRYKRIGLMEDLDEGIALAKEALDLCPKGCLDRSRPLHNLAVHLSVRYRQLGIMEDLGKAIILHREAFDLRTAGHPDRPYSLINLAGCLATRFDQSGIKEDLDEAIVLSREALDLCPKGHPQRAMALSELGMYLFKRCGMLRVIGDLDAAIVFAREALELRLKGHPDRSTSLTNLAICLAARSGQLKVMVDLNEAIALDREALDIRPEGHNDPTLLHNLATHLSARYRQLGSMEDIDEAIVLDREALDFCPKGHHRWSASLDILARHLFERFIRSKQTRDVEELFNVYAQLVHFPQNVFVNDHFAARGWVQMAEVFRHLSILFAYETSIRLLVQHLAILPSLAQHLGVLKDLTSSLAVDAFSACLRNRSPVKAVELLEQGRGVFWSQLTRLRPPLDDVIASGTLGKNLANEFTRLASLVRRTFDSPVTGLHERLYHLNLEMEKVVTGIRRLPGFSRFLLPSLFSDLQRAASEGPVIIVNASKYSCDALVILLDRDPVHIPLQMTLESVRDLSKEITTLTARATKADVTRELAVFLRKLWDQIVSSIVDSVLTTCPPCSRIWWCPTGEFSMLPLHAAGPYRKGQQNLPELYISSYTPTLTALIRARRLAPPGATTQGKRFVAIGQAKATGAAELLSVDAELDIISQRVDTLATFTRLGGDESCILRVVEALKKHEWVHLACHGLPERTQPFESAFALYDGHFTIQQIIGCDLKDPEFAYLSACHTTVGYEESPDEVIHLASAMQFIGFRSVIGTMWAVDDGETNKITSTFYKHMVDEESGHLDHTRAALALNKTMRSVHLPLDQQILYVHIGA